MQSKTTLIIENNGVKAVQFQPFCDSGLVSHGFSTKHGGVSEGAYSTMNLSFTRGDDEESVRENFRRFSESIGVSVDSLVLSDQIHETKVIPVTVANTDHPLQGVDGLMTDKPGVTLTTFYADCVPLFFLDPKNKVIALSHAGWRGTVKGMASVTVEAMMTHYECDPNDILVGIGPSIQQCCYEVSEEVINEFENQLNRDIIDEIATRKANGRYMLNLQEANKRILLLSGIREENITISDLCTKCHSEDFFSHRVMGTNRGSLAAMLALKA